MAAIILKVGEEEYPLRFDCQAWLDVEEKYGALDSIRRRIAGREKPMHAGIDLIEIMSRGGARKHGGGSVTAKKLKEHLSPDELIRAISKAMDALTVGMAREHADDEDKPIDVVRAKLEREKQKNAESCSTDEP